ncbi:hypothetical protein EDB92DRAFT_2107125 [Lactarius akahatsu]|uniref:Uncharacterized protein n=1 Tax=Lactarius akahatsu TaxID=416441 RepID=A0AAD4Q5X7_9AGAM|nr:hypothetical protein EDB92DRAFT_2107125 [Lactarius akahatsu]
MTDWKSPVVITAEYFALIKLYHAIWGALIWEFVVNIGFEYSVFTGKRKFRLSFLLYLAARWCPLFCVITILVGFDPVNQVNCQAFVIFVFLFSHLSLACAEALIVMRIAAIWGLNKIAISIASAAWLADVGTLIHGVVVLHGTWSRDLPVGACIITNTLETRTNIIVSFVTDLVLLALMLTGLLRWENARRKGGIWWLLFTQGLAWMIIVTVAEAPITVFILLNLNVVAMTIGASRVYRGLSDYVHKEGDVHMSRGLPVRQAPIGGFLPRPGRGSLALGTSGTLDVHMFEMDSMAPPKHPGKMTSLNCRENRVATGKALDLKGDMCGCQFESTNEALVPEVTTFELGGPFTVIRTTYPPTSPPIT